jgi:hypothetical protein
MQEKELRPPRKEWWPKSTKADKKLSADAHMVFVLPAEFHARTQEEPSVVQLDLGPRPVIFEKPQAKNYKHLKALYLKGYINGQPINKMLVDTGAAINIMPYSVLHRLGRSTGDLIKTNVTLSDFNGQTSEAQGFLSVVLTIGNKTVPTSFFVVNSKSTYNVLLGRDWIHTNCCIPSTMHQCLIQWDGDEVEVVQADDSIEISHAAMSIWDAEDQETISGMSLEGCDRIKATKKWSKAGLIHRPYRIKEPQEARRCSEAIEADSCNRPQKIEFLMSSISHSCYGMASAGSRPYSFCKNLNNNGMRGMADLNDRPEFFLLSSFSICSIDLTEDGKLGYGFTSADELEEIDIGPEDKPRPTFISRKLHPSLRELMITLLKEYADCFAWDYTEMPGLDRSIVEHRLPFKSGFRPFQQRARQMKAEVLVEVKKEVEKMLEAGFIRTCRYAEWISSVVPVQKKDGRWRVCVDFRDLNRATPKDEYPMPIAETLINVAVGHKILSFMDGNAGYNQIFMAPEDIHKTAFRVLGAVGLFEYVVMTFGLKNAGATYQRAMNHIFHDLIGNLVEIYIDDVVVKSASVEGHLDDLRQVLERTRKFGLRMNPKKCAFGVSAGQFLGFLVYERGIEIGLKSQEAVRAMVPPTTKKEL